MEFEEQEAEQDEEMEMEIPASYDSPQLNSNSAGPPSQLGRVKMPGVSTGEAKPRYRECLKNHAVGLGGHAVDGCGEFLPAGAEGTIDALKCAACHCHRNFHRKDTEPPRIFPHEPYGLLPAGNAAVGPQFSTYYRAPAGFLQVRPLALPSTSGGGGTATEDQEDGSDVPLQAVMMQYGSSATTNTTSSSGKKRFRTKFSSEQKERMLGLAERLGWRIQKQDEPLVQEFCSETGVKRHVLKVWMHNNKHTLGKKP